MDDLISFLPPEIAEVVKALCALIAACSLLAAAVKRIMGEPRETDSAFRVAVFSVLHWIDILAANTETVKSKTRRMYMEADKRRNSGAPLMLALMLALSPSLQACAHSSLSAHAKAADISAGVIDQAGAAIEHASRVAEESAVAAAVSRDEAAQRVAEARERFAPIEAAYEALRAAHGLYVDAIVEADRTGRDLEPDRLRAVGLAWMHLSQLADLLRVKLPNAPDELLELLGGKA